MICVKDIMTTDLITIIPDESVHKAINVMDEHHIGCLPVLDNGLLRGILTSRDVRRSHPNRLVADAMSPNLITVKQETSVLEALELLDKYNIERLVVANGEYLLGIVTKAQVLAEIGKHIDSLTGLFKAGIMLLRMNELIKGEKSFSIMFLDLDNFGNIDKKFGHVVGDQILKQVADLLQNLLNKSYDSAYRYAGDEFVIVTTRGKDETHDLAKMLISCFSQNAWSPNIEVTVSIGIVSSAFFSPSSEKDEPPYCLRLINLASLASTTAKKEQTSMKSVDDKFFERLNGIA